MLTIRLTRKGKKNQPFFRVVVIDKKRSSKGGRAVEDLGYVDPLTKRKNFKKERIQYWLSKGAKPSPTMHNFLVSEKIIDAKKIHVSKLSKKAKEAAAKVAATPESPKVNAPAETPSTNPVQQAAPELSPAPEEKLVEAPKEVKPTEDQKEKAPAV